MPNVITRERFKENLTYFHFSNNAKALFREVTQSMAERLKSDG